MKRVRGLVLCGGPGKRLRPITYYFQKSMVPIGRLQKPLLEYIVRLLKYYGITDVAFLVGYKSNQIINYFDDGRRLGIKISYVEDDKNFKGTGGAVLNAYKRGFINEEETILIYYGDILSNLNLTEMINHHEKKGASATVALSTQFVVSVGLAELKSNGKLRGFIEKPKLDKPVSMGMLILEGEIMEELKSIFVEGRDLDLMRDVIPHLIEIDEPVFGYVTEAFWYDVGSAEAYEKIDFDMIDRAFSTILEETSIIT